jgi:hypothetical protein
VTEDLITLKDSSINICLYKESEIKKEELANALLKRCEKVQEKLNTIPLNQQNNYIEEWSLVQYQVQEEELLSEKSKENT